MRRAFIKEWEGASILEFAFVAPLFLIILLSLFHLSYIMLVRHALEAGLHSGLARVTIDPTNSVQKIVEAVNRNGMGVVSIQASNVQAFQYPSISDARNNTNSTPVSEDMVPGTVVKYRVTYPVTYLLFNVGA